ncbi:NO-binding membrane sensor protein with MHYT domain [Actinomadura pelletieri DSM 43383]|uniref:NO-binding membrane sensor protein with MHYT domain n=1 Tax=Actinomadura pelletieri DSM 43383 TaxID=1120940 RepID=A0A495QQ44_9ACTN|nr:MHYT domain-containing protein [Actinomadura pelletieri]RKS75068.1 NO-binding membrane sensor protein with MHYT domain [Actinomadura pelletieri DSM 43383]
MSEVHHFSYGLLTPVLAYVMSVIGSLLGLLCTARARGTSGGSRASWLVLAGTAIGGTGIWVMHFIAMLGFTVPGTEIRYNVPLTLLSCAIAVVVVAAGLFVVGFGSTGPIKIVVGGVVMGVGVASMHYMGMAAMNMAGDVSYRTLLVALSVVIAVVASSVALLFALNIRGGWATAGAALIMGVAVTGMHYTGMAAMQVAAHTEQATPAGATATDFLMPLIGGMGVVSVVLLAIIAMAPTEDEMRVDAALQERVRARQNTIVPQAAPPPYTPTEPRRTRSTGEWFDG